MKLSRKAGVLCVVCMGIATGAWAQFMHGRMGSQTPNMPGMIHPVVGSGAEYQMTSKGDTTNFSYAVVGKEQAEGKDAYWLEIRSEGGKLKGEMVMKQLMVLDSSHPEIKRMIMQPPGQPPMEMPMGMMSMMQHRAQANSQTEDGGPGEKIGTETITVPAGSFECDHYRRQENGKPIDYWISSKVSPYGLVKMSSDGMTMVLDKVLSSETTHIKGEPQKMNIPNF